MKSFRQYLTEERNVTKFKYHDYLHETDPEHHQEHFTQNMHFGTNDYIPFNESEMVGESSIVESYEQHPSNPKHLIFRHDGAKSKGATGLVVPKHMWDGGFITGGRSKKGEPKKPKKYYPGMDKRNELRAEVYGGENRPPLALSHMEAMHKKILDDHFTRREHESVEAHTARQHSAETEALGRLRKAGHLANDAITTDEGEKTDTVHHEFDEHGRSFIARSSKGVAGHAIYTSGHAKGGNEEHHVITTCVQATSGCGGGIDAHGVANTLKGSCFAPKAEHQYVSASIKRACHEQAKFDPKMTKDWILAHAHSLRTVAEQADKKNKRFLFRPNVVDETDRSSRHVIRHLNAQRASTSLPPIIGNSYGKTDELHDPENHWHVTYSNIGPKVKHGAQITENRIRDVGRIRETQTAVAANRKDYVNEQGNKTPPKNSYMVINAGRGSERNQDFEKHVTHVKYWSGGRRTHLLSDHEKSQGLEGHYDGNGKPTTPELAHYGHKTLTSVDTDTKTGALLKDTDGNHIMISRRYDYQKQHVLHPRLVDTENDKGEIHKIPTDSRFMDHKFLPEDKHRYKSVNGKNAGAVLITTPTTSTSEVQHHSIFTHDVSDSHIEHAKTHRGEYEIDKPEHQEAAAFNEYKAPEAPAEHEKKARVKKAVAKTKISLEQNRLARHFA